MKKYVCTVCGYIYDPEVGEESANVAPGTAWEDVPEDFLCPYAVQEGSVRAIRGVKDVFMQKTQR